MDRDHAQRFEHSGAARCWSVEEVALRCAGAECHASPGVPASADRERVCVQQVWVADAVVSGVADVVCFRNPANYRLRMIFAAGRLTHPNLR
jgi:hypothetical protein